jgi:hypothetical protein
MEQTAWATNSSGARAHKEKEQVKHDRNSRQIGYPKRKTNPAAVTGQLLTLKNGSSRRPIRRNETNEEIAVAGSGGKNSWLPPVIKSERNQAPRQGAGKSRKASACDTCL